MKKIILFIFILCCSQCFSELNPGDSISSSTNLYTIIEELGEGAFGKVYSVENSSGKRFALKSYKPFDTEFFSSGWINSLADAKREFSIGQLLDHPNIIKSIEFFEDASEKQTHYLVLELVDGSELYKTPKKIFSEEEVRKSLKQFVSALRYVLKFNLIHTDLHIANIMMTDTSDIKIIDLASFFSLEEFYDFIEATQNTSEIQSKNAKHKLEIIRQKKLQEFFDKRPELLVKAQELIKKHKKNKFQKKGADLNNFFTVILSYNFDAITQICLEILSKSTMNRDEKIALQAEIKKLSWNYIEDIDDGIYPTSDYYFEQLTKLLER